MWVRVLLLSLPVMFIAACIMLRDYALWLAENILPECVTYSEFGIYCPGCGLTRCILAVMNGDILLAIRNNAAVMALILFVILFYGEIVLFSFGKDVHLLPRNVWFWVTFGVLCALYIVLRNFVPQLQPISLSA